MKKHAYLIIANRNPNQLKMLLSVLDDSRNDIYLYIDNKSKKEFPSKYNLNFSKVYLASSSDIYWGDYSLIQAELSLFRMARSNGRYEYYHLLSGLDLPLVNQDIIHDFFDKHLNKEFITYSTALTKEMLSTRLHKYHLRKSFRNGTIFERAFHKIENNVYSKVPTKKLEIEKINFGSNWVSLDDELVNDLITHDNEIYNIFHSGYLVDELFIPVFINLHPKYKRKIYYDRPVTDKPDEFQGNLRYINWWDGSPYTWRDKDYDKLVYARKMGHLFSRKFDENVDDKIIKRIVDYDLK